MNKKQLAKLLIKHPEIKALYESREFDASTINKIVAEEIMREDEDEEGEGRVSKADKQARATLDAEDSVSNLDPSLSDNEIRKQFRDALKSATTLEKIDALDKEASKILDPKYARTLKKDIKAAKARIEGGSTNDSEEDPVKKELIQSMKSEIEFLKTLLSDPNEMPLDKKEYKEAIEEYTKKLEAMGVAVAKTDSIEDDKAFVKSIADSKPEIKQTADAVKTAGDDGFAETFPDLDAAIMASLKGSKDAVTAANDDLDLSDIEIEDAEEPATEDDLTGNLRSIGTFSSREIFIGVEVPGLGKIPYYRSTGKGTGKESTGQIVPFLGFAQVFMQGHGSVLGYFVKIEKNNPKLKVNFDKIPGRVSGKKGALKDMDQSQLDLGDNSKAFNDIHKQLNNLQENVKPGAKKLAEKVKEAYGKEDYTSKLMQILKILKLQTKLKNEGYLREDLVSSNYQLYLRDPVFLSNGVVLSVELQQEVSDEFSSHSPNAEQPVNDEVEQDSNDSSKDPIDKALDWVETEEAAKLFKNPVANTLAIGDALENLGLDMSPFSSINPQDILSQPKGDVVAVLKRAKASGDSQVEEPPTEEGTASAVEAIETGNTEEVEVNLADVEAAKEELKPEIEKDPQKEANAEELKNKVEKKKMSDPKKLEALKGVSQIAKAFEKAQADIKKRIAASASGNESDMDNLPTQEEILGGAIQAMKTVLEKIQNSSSWDDLASAGIWPTAIKTRKDANQLPEFEEWRTTNLPKVQEKFETLRDSLGTVDLSSDDDSSIANVQSTLADAAATIGTAIQNNDATGDLSGDDSSGADIAAKTDLEAIREILPELKDKFPNLFKFDGFVKNLAQALMNTEPSLDSDGEEGELVDATGTANSSDTNIASDVSSDSTGDDVGGLGESLSGIYLTEEGEVDDTKVDDTADDTTGQPLDVADATVLQAELEELRKILEPKKINVEELLPQDLKDALAKAPESDVEVEPKTAEQAAVDGDTASGIDARKEQADAIEIYSALIQPMDDFFSTDQAQRLGFMEQFLLESQSKMLWALIGNLTLIAEKGKAKAFTNRAEKEEAGMSGEAAPEAEVEPTAEPEVQAEGRFNPFNRDKEPVEISKEDQISLKTDLKALLQTLRATKSMIGSYERNMTKVSVDPGLDGSALKEQLDQYLPMVQKSIAKIVERANEAFIKATELNAPKEKPEVSQPADAAQPSPTPPTEPEVTQEGMINAIFEAMQPALHEMSLMQEDSRDETINFVDSVYKNMRLIYAPVGGGEDSEGLRGFMETGDRARTIQQAEKMLELATKEDFTKLFPGGRIGEGGMPATVNAATETMNREIKKLVLIMRDVVTLASKSVIPHSKLVEIVNSLTTISKSLYNSFGAKMMISGESLAQIETRLGEDKNNKSLTDQETKPGMMDKLGNLAGKAGELAGKGLEKLKQMFGWMSEETRKLLLKFFGEESELIDGLSNSDLSEEQQEALVEEVVESKTWYESLEQDAKSAVDALVKYLINEVGRESLKQLNYPAVVSERLDNEERTSISRFAQETQETFGKQLSNRTYKFLHSADEEIKSSSMKLMIDQTDEFVSYLTTIFKIVDKISKEAAEEMVSPNQENASNEPMDAEDEDGGDIEGLAKAPSTLKDRAIKMFEKKSGKSAPKPSDKGVSIFDYKSFASLLIFFMGQKNVNEEANAPSGKVNSGKDMETILKDGELSEQFFKVDDSLGGGLTKYAIKKYSFLSGVMSSLSKKFAPHFEKNNIELPNQTRPVQQQSDPSDVDPSADPFGDATKDQDPEEKPESKKIGLKASLLKISPKLRQKFINSKDVKQGNLSATTKFLAIAVVNSVMTETPIDPDLGAEVDLSEDSERSLFVSQILNKMKNTEMVEKIKTFMMDVKKGQKTYINLFDLYGKSINPPKESYAKLAQYLDAMTEKAKEVKEEGFIYKNAGNLTALNTDLATEKPKSFALEESLRPIIEKMLNEHYNH